MRRLWMSGTAASSEEEEEGAAPDALGPERKSGGNSPPIPDPPGGDHRNGRYGVDDLWHEYHSRDSSSVSPRLAALGYYDVHSGVDVTAGVPGAAGHANDLHSELMSVLGHPARRPQGRNEHWDLFFQNHLDLTSDEGRVVCE